MAEDSLPLVRLYFFISSLLIIDNYAKSESFATIGAIYVSMQVLIRPFSFVDKNCSPKH
jgi:hypothetical protein